MFENYSDLCTIKEMCEMLNIGKTLAYELIRKGTIPSRMIGGKRAIPKNAIIRYYLKQDKKGYFPKPPEDFTYYRAMR